MHIYIYVILEYDYNILEKLRTLGGEQPPEGGNMCHC